MRDIKFRAKRLDEDEWVYGSFIQSCYNEPAQIKQCEGCREDPAWNYYDVKPETVGQYLECSDKDGKAIYEHDIVKDADNALGVVFCEGGNLWIGSYGNGFTGLRSFTAADSILGDDLRKECLVIGNIHDDPNFMEG